MIKVVLVAPYPKLKQLADEIFAGYPDKGVRLKTVYAVGVKIIKTLDFDCDVVIARGVTATALQAAHRDLPVISLPVTGYDVIRAVDESKRKYKPGKIAFVGSDNMIYGVQSIAGILGMEISCYRIREEEEAEQCVIEAARQEAEVIIGGAMTVEIAARQGINTVLIESGGEAIMQALDEAVRTARVTRQERANAERFKAIIDYAYEGILAVDEGGEVTIFNKSAQQLANLNARSVIGRPIADILPETGLLRVMKTGKEELGELHKIGGTMVVTNRVPVKVKNKVVGAVATFQNVAKLQEVEGRIREKIHSKGLRAKYTFRDCIGNSQAIRDVLHMAQKFSMVDSNILIIGETGTGKELFAQSIHNASERAREPFVAVNCAALPENLLESELFGYVEGAFTGAAKGGKPGLFELAHRGTIFLDEISEIPLRLQGRLLRVLQEREIMRLGHDRVIPVDVRIISATNIDLRQLIAQGGFRLDLLYRLDVLRLSIPSLCNRKEDILPLMDYYLQIYSQRLKKIVKEITPAAQQLLVEHDWPGNIREICNVCERLAVLTVDGIIDADDINRVVDIGLAQPQPAAPEKLQCNRRENGQSFSELEKERIVAALEKTGWSKVQAAALLQMGRTTLWRRLKEYGIE